MTETNEIVMKADLITQFDCVSQHFVEGNIKFKN